jgi:hypothetical protein
MSIRALRLEPRLAVRRGSAHGALLRQEAATPRQGSVREGQVWATVQGPGVRWLTRHPGKSVALRCTALRYRLMGSSLAPVRRAGPPAPRWPSPRPPSDDRDFK